LHETRFVCGALLGYRRRLDIFRSRYGDSTLMSFTPQRTILRLPDRSLLWAVNKRGMGQLPGEPGFVGPLSPEEQMALVPTVIDAATNQPVSAADQAAYASAYQSGLLNLAYQQGKAAGTPPASQPFGITLPSWVMPVGVGLTALVVLSMIGGGRR
jgi:hypothetical protein